MCKYGCNYASQLPTYLVQYTIDTGTNNAENGLLSNILGRKCDSLDAKVTGPALLDNTVDLGPIVLGEILGSDAVQPVGLRMCRHGGNGVTADVEINRANGGEVRRITTAWRVALVVVLECTYSCRILNSEVSIGTGGKQKRRSGDGLQHCEGMGDAGKLSG